MTLRARILSCVCCLLMTPLIGACAYRYVTEDGRQRVIGLVSMTIDPVSAEPAPGAIVSTKSVGVSILRQVDGTDVTVGYADIAVLTMPQNGAVFLNRRQSSLLGRDAQ